jgi:uncharacterized RDD family membrane protein YckC
LPRPRGTSIRARNALFDWAASLGQAGRLIGFATALLYFGLLNSHFGGGQTLGKRLLGIRVVDRNGDTLSAMRSVVRFLVLGVPYFLNGLWFDLDPSSIGPAIRMLFVLLVLLVFGGGGAIVYLFAFNRRTRQSLHDLVVGSFVVRSSAVTVPVTLAIARLHLIITGCWLALTLIVPAVFVWIAYEHGDVLAKRFQPLADLQTALRSELGVRATKVTMGRTITTSTGNGTSTTDYLQVEAQPNAKQDDFDALALQIAGVVLDRDPDLLGKQVLIVQVQRRFDFGIAGWSHTRREAYSGAGWRAKLNRPAYPGKS